MELIAASREIHRDSVEAGWWNHPDTQEPRSWIDRFPECIALIHSEISEAHDAYRDGLADSHLPHYAGRTVEAADTVIRICDLIGAILIDTNIRPLAAHLPPPHKGLAMSMMLDAHASVSRALEEFRVFRRPKIIISHLLRAAAEIAKAVGPDDELRDVIAEKREYNRHRADHKREARAAKGGKKL